VPEASQAPAGTTPEADEDPPYEGPDRRGVIAEGVLAADNEHVTLLLGSIGLCLLVTGGLLVGLPLSAASLVSASTGTTDLAFVVLLGATAALVMRWKLVGEARAGLLAPAAAVASLLVITTATSPAATNPYALAVRGLGVVVLLGLVLRACDAVDIRAGLCPARSFSLLGVPILAAIPIALTPARLLVVGSVLGVHPAGIAEAVSCWLVATALVVPSRRRGRLLVVAAGALVALIGLGCGLDSSSAAVGGRAGVVPGLLLLAGAVGFAAVAVLDLRGAIHVVVRYDARGRRRWEAAETELELWHRTQEGRVHDLSSALSAMDGTLLSVMRGRGRLSRQAVEHLLGSVREQIQWFRTFLIAGDGPPREYDVGALLSAIADLRSSELTVELQADPGLRGFGRPDRMAFAVNNLLANCSRYAPSARVRLSARRVRGAGRATIEVSVADDGPGIAAEELEHLGRRGWRSPATAGGVPGSGLGLYQCAELLAGDGGELRAELSDANAPLGHQGLVVHISVPAADESPQPTESAQLATIHQILLSRFSPRSSSGAQRAPGR
jgi:signal transduction histidine kinase